MKKQLILIALALCLVLPLISAEDVGYTFDNIKSVDYNKMGLGYPEITIKNSFAWIIPLDPILDTKITMNTPRCPNGKCKLEQSFNNYYDTASLEEDRFVDAKGNEIKDIQVSHYTYKTETYIETIIESQDKKCVENSKTHNGTMICTYTNNYKNITKERTIKVPYTLGEKKLGINIIGTEADISKYDWVDYQMKSNGVWLSEYVGWTTADCLAVGGDVAIDGNYCVHTITSNLTFNVTGTISAEVLVIAGGGGGGGCQDNAGAGGGGGAGGYIYNTSYTLTGSLNAYVGLGGEGGTNSGDIPNKTGKNGADSTFGALTSIGGGGGGGNFAQGGRNGGSGGGAGGDGTWVGAYGNETAGQGNHGGLSQVWNAPKGGTGGGGGAGAVGANANTDSGAGGVGKYFWINGTNITYAGGGGGGQSGQGALKGLGGSGGGGSGGGALPRTF